MRIGLKLKEAFKLQEVGMRLQLFQLIEFWNFVNIKYGSLKMNLQYFNFIFYDRHKIEQSFRKLF